MWTPPMLTENANFLGVVELIVQDVSLLRQHMWQRGLCRGGGVVQTMRCKMNREMCEHCLKTTQR